MKNKIFVVFDKQIAKLNDDGNENYARGCGIKS